MNGDRVASTAVFTYGSKDDNIVATAAVLYLLFLGW
jgi:hypothetical protein